MSVHIINSDCRDALHSMPNESVHCCVTSPPYFGLRDYGMAGQIGLETSPDEFVERLIDVFREVRRVLRDDGTLWLNLGDSYASNAATAKGKSNFESYRGSSETESLNTQHQGRNAYRGAGIKSKDLLGIPWRVAFALQADGWYLRQDIIWSKPNPMPESVTDRCTKAHEYIFLLSKLARYYYDRDAIAEPFADANRSSYKAGSASNMNDGEHVTKSDAGLPLNEAGRNKRSVWEVTTQPFSEAHFATFPPALIEPCILAGCPVSGTVLDPFGGAGTTGLVADRLQRNAILIELNPDYAAMARKRIQDDAPLFVSVNNNSI